MYRRILVIFGAISCLSLSTLTLLRPQYINSVQPTSVKDTLSSSQLSYFGRLGSGNTAADSTVRVQLSGNPSNTTANLFIGDTIGIGISGANGLSTYSVRDVGNTASFQVNTGLGTTNFQNGLMVVATRSAIHTISFTPKSSSLNYKWQFLIKSTNRAGEQPNDGIPDQQGFDIGSTIPSGPTSGAGTRLQVADISCPFGGTASVGTTVVVSGSTYHSIICDNFLGGTHPIDVGTTITIGRALASGSQLVNPSAALNHVEGQANSSADIYTFYIRHLDASSNVVDSDTVSGKIAVVEAVRVTATIDPTLTFIIDNGGLAAGSTACGNTLGTNANNTTATSVAYGSLSLGAFNDLAQRISCVTNAATGYVVTVYENGQIKEISSGTTIPDTNCDGGCGVGTTAAWTTDNTHSEWGYSMQNIGASAVGVGYSDASSAFIATAFGNGPSQAQTVMYSGVTPQQTERALMCYRLTASTTQEAGNYEGKLIYTATATF